MAEKHVANSETGWQAICVLPDICKVGMKPVPFDSFRDLAPYLQASPNVNARGTPVYPLTGIISGTEGNAGKGIISQTSKQPGNVVMLADTTTVKVNGLPSARHDTLVQMNVSPIGPNCIGKLCTDQGGPLGTTADKKVPCNDPPKSSPKLEELQALKDKLKGMDPSQLDEYVRFGDWNKSLDDGIAQIQTPKSNTGIGWLDSTADAVNDVGDQVSRGVLGFGKDIVMGLGQLAYSGAKLMTPGGQLHAGLDMAMLMEHIRLGNVCLQTLKDAAKKAGHELAKPVTDAWEKGNYVEAVTRAGLEIASLLLVIGDLAKLAKGAQVAKAAEVTKAAEAAKAAEAQKAAEVAKASEAQKTAETQKAAEASKAGGDGVKVSKLHASKDPRYARGKFRRGVREKVWEDAKGPDGKVRDSVTGKEINANEPWDMGHKPGHEHWKHQESAAERGLSREQFLNEYNNPSSYRPELPSSNRSHAGEIKTNDYFGP